MNKKKISFIIISVIVCILVYLPTPKKVDPQQYNPGKFTPLQDLKISKDKLKNAVFITTPAPGAEDVEIDGKGNVYSGLHDGSIVRVDPGSLEMKVVGRSQGAIFGIDISRNGSVLALADQSTGIKLLDLTTGNFEYIASQYNGKKFASPNGVVFGKNDQILYFTVSSQIIPMSQFHQMLLYSESSGRIFSYDLNSRQLQLLADQLYFVNGIQYDEKQNCLYFVETSRSRLSKLDLKPQKKGVITKITDKILGYPDNVKLSSTGDLWVAIPALRDSFTNIIDHNSVIRRMLLNLRMPFGMFMALSNMKYAGGIKIDPKNGQIVDYFFGDSQNINCISGINQAYGKLYLSSLSKNKIAIVDISDGQNHVQTQRTQQVNIPKKEQIVTKKQQKKQQIKKIQKQVQKAIEKPREISNTKQDPNKKRIKLDEPIIQKQQTIKQKIVQIKNEIKDKVQTKVQDIKNIVKDTINIASQKIQEVKNSKIVQNILGQNKKQDKPISPQISQANINQNIPLNQQAKNIIKQDIVSAQKQPLVEEQLINSQQDIKTPKTPNTNTKTPQTKNIDPKQQQTIKVSTQTKPQPKQQPTKQPNTRSRNSQTQSSPQANKYTKPQDPRRSAQYSGSGSQNQNSKQNYNQGGYNRNSRQQNYGQRQPSRGGRNSYNQQL